MIQLKTILDYRRSELRGSPTPESDLAALSDLIAGTEFAGLLDLYSCFPVAGQVLAFEANHEGEVTAPGSDFMNPYDPACHHAFDWYSARQIVFDATETLLGKAAWASRFLPIGVPTIGGDLYYLKKSATGEFSLYVVYNDCIRPDEIRPVPEDGCKLVARRFADVIKIARF